MIPRKRYAFCREGNRFPRFRIMLRVSLTMSQAVKYPVKQPSLKRPYFDLSITPHRPPTALRPAVQLAIKEKPWTDFRFSPIALSTLPIPVQGLGQIAALFLFHSLLSDRAMFRFLAPSPQSLFAALL